VISLLSVFSLLIPGFLRGNITKGISVNWLHGSVNNVCSEIWCACTFWCNIYVINFGITILSKRIKWVINSQGSLK